MKGTAMNRSVGFVTKIRVNPKDVMSCIDCVNAVKLNMQGMSLSAVISRGLAIAMHTLRSSEAIPTRDGFEYLAMIEPYDHLTRVEKIEAGHKIVVQNQNAEQMDANPVEALPTKRIKYEPTEAELAKARARQRIMRRIDEMNFKKKADPKNWSKKDQAALVAAEQELVS